MIIELRVFKDDENKLLRKYQIIMDDDEFESLIPPPAYYIEIGDIHFALDQTTYNFATGETYIPECVCESDKRIEKFINVLASKQWDCRTILYADGGEEAWCKRLLNEVEEN